MKAAREVLSADRLGSIDFLLAGVAGALATFSLGMALGRSMLGLFFAVGIAAGMAVAYGVQRVYADRRWLELSGFLYFFMAMGAVFYAQSLNAILPEGGLQERELAVASVLAWMVLLGSFFAWRDSTLLFQAVPSIALFGLVGAFNTYEGSTVAFFIFLLCLATLFARAHARSMFKVALESGYLRTDQIRQGPWRWMAGPEWALASAAVVILISAFGAPILQESVKGVSGIVRIPVPPMPRPSPSTASLSIPGAANSSSNSVQVGAGPLLIGERLIFSAKLDRPRYLRSSTYSTYSNGSWNKVPIDNELLPEIAEDTRRDRDNLIGRPEREQIPFEIAYSGVPLGALPAPGDVVSLAGRQFTPQLDGGIVLRETPYLNAKYSGITSVVKDGVEPVNVPVPLPEILWRYATSGGNSGQIAELSDAVTANAQTDYEKAIAIQREIERRCKYNLNAEAAPRGTDPVENFLFGKVREGYCDLFASAMVLMARAQGIPARYVRGFYPLMPDEDGDGWYEITENCSHAWAELYFENVGWIPFDPTEGAVAVEGGGRGGLNDTRPFYKREWFAWFLNGIIGLCIVGAGFFAIRSVRSVRAAVDWDKVEMGRNYAIFTAALQRASGQPKRPSQTATEYVGSVAPFLGSFKDEAMRINGLFVQALYGPPNAGRPKAEDLKGPVRAFRKALQKSPRRA